MSVINQLPSLPVGLLFGRSVNVTRAGGMLAACATSHDVLSTNWYASDAWCGPGQSLSANVSHWGPFASEAIAKRELNGADLADLAATGTDGISLWLVLP